MLRVVGEDSEVCRSSAAPEVPPPPVTAASQNDDWLFVNFRFWGEDEYTRHGTYSWRESIDNLSDGILTDIFPDMAFGEGQPEIADGTLHDTYSGCVKIDDLPDEVLIKIFSYVSFSVLVDAVPKVCLRWRRLSQDLELWADKEYEIRHYCGCDTDTCKGGMTDEGAIQTFCDAPNLVKVRMVRPVRSRVFRALYSSCHRLSELHMHTNQQLSYSVLKNLFEKCSRIHTLTLSDRVLQSEECSEAVSRLEHLRVLSLAVSYAGSAPVLGPLGDGCPRLAEVDFGIATPYMDDLRHFFNGKRNTLKSVRIKWTMAGRRCVLPLLTVCANCLERLQLYDFDIVRDEAREAFTALGSLKNLRELKMQINEPLPPGVGHLAFKTGLPKLRLLDLEFAFGMDDNTVIAISRGCPVLRELNLRGADRLSDAAFSQVYHLKHLEILNVSACKGLGGALIPCLARLPQLHTLIMEELEFPVLQPGLNSILELSGVRSLTLDSSLVTGVPFDRFPGKLVSLRVLSVQWCRGDPTATDGLVEQMPGLELHGYIEVEEPDADEEFHESDAEGAEEENGENAELDDAEGAEEENGENAELDDAD
ncbi:F-box/LRR-repeat protein 17-like [Schistocerca cancellata]|uniref:F-box/LRR-repeat protein 17-like n=1 Tax=Schistocerca cancellata TaxID=274614 RepID=UPI0021193B7A|nr:F-box/LRR-repeat protein 17-like [Schistocerca cancellata]